MISAPPAGSLSRKLVDQLLADLVDQLGAVHEGDLSALTGQVRGDCIPDSCAAPVTTATFAPKRPWWIMSSRLPDRSCPGRLLYPGPHRFLAALGVLDEDALRGWEVISVEGAHQVQVVLGDLLAGRTSAVSEEDYARQRESVEKMLRGLVRG